VEAEFATLDILGENNSSKDGTLHLALRLAIAAAFVSLHLKNKNARPSVNLIPCPVRRAKMAFDAVD
jgi:hypothetical protein